MSAVDDLFLGFEVVSGHHTNTFKHRNHSMGDQSELWIGAFLVFLAMACGRLRFDAADGAPSDAPVDSRVDAPMDATDDAAGDAETGQVDGNLADTNCPCDLDVNDRGGVNIADFTDVGVCIGETAEGICKQADVNCDGVIDMVDVDIVLCGQVPDADCCPGP